MNLYDQSVTAPIEFNARPLLVFGPTASGKSAYAMARAAERPSLIINADSMQVYADLRILTARPTLADEAAVPHRMFGHVDGADAYSTGRYARDLSEVLAEAARDRLRPIIVGGTGLYFRAILQGLSPVPPIPDAIREAYRARQREAGTAEVYRELSLRDPAMAARLQPSDPQRIIRALEVLEATGRSLADWQQQPGAPLLRVDDCEPVVISPPRSVNRAQADERLDRMVADGALGEVERLLARDLDPALPVMRTLGVSQLAASLRGAASIEAALAATRQDTHAYIKRQSTWLKRNMTSWQRHQTQ